MNFVAAYCLLVPPHIAIKKNIRLLKENPEKVGGNKQTAKELIGLLECVSDDQAWIAANAMAGLSLEKALETLNSMRV